MVFTFHFTWINNHFTWSNQEIRVYTLYSKSKCAFTLFCHITPPGEMLLIPPHMRYEVEEELIGY